jgi:hypothetical protein
MSCATAISETLDRAFRAAHLLTASADLAEEAVLGGIAVLDSSDDVEKVLVAKTVDFVIRQSGQYPHRLEGTLSVLPQELRHLLLLAPVSRDCFVLRTLFGIAPPHCAATLNLTLEEFEEALYAAYEQLPKGKEMEFRHDG